MNESRRSDWAVLGPPITKNDCGAYLDRGTPSWGVSAGAAKLGAKVCRSVACWRIARRCGRNGRWIAAAAARERLAMIPEKARFKIGPYSRSSQAAG
jgi:hypothetical protein